jgi:hypothetical protein
MKRVEQEIHAPRKDERRRPNNKRHSNRETRSFMKSSINTLAVTTWREQPKIANSLNR